MVRETGVGARATGQAQEDGPRAEPPFGAGVPALIRDTRFLDALYREMALSACSVGLQSASRTAALIRLPSTGLRP